MQCLESIHAISVNRRGLHFERASFARWRKIYSEGRDSFFWLGVGHDGWNLALRLLHHDRSGLEWECGNP